MRRRDAPDNISKGEIRTENETAGTICTEERDSGLEIEVEQGTTSKSSFEFCAPIYRRFSQDHPTKKHPLNLASHTLDGTLQMAYHTVSDNTPEHQEIIYLVKCGC